MAEEEALKILTLFTPDGKRRLGVMPMGDLNEAPTFVSMMTKLHMEWYTLVKEHGLKMLYQKLLFMMCYCMGAQPDSF